jgi:predicted enzyme related to lactoylglutathione lyase/uncharacterized protein YciI
MSRLPRRALIASALGAVMLVSAMAATPELPASLQKEIARGRAYALVFLKAGPARGQSAEETARLQVAHLTYLFRLRAEGKLVINGPLTSDGELRGLSIYNTDVAEARRLAEADPAVQAGRLVVEAHPWFGLPGDSLPGTDNAQHDQRVDYVEFVAPDLAAAKAFYAAAFGWQFTDYGPDYTSFADGRLSGGFRRGERAAATHPLIVIYARDLEATETKVRAAGGRISTATHTFPGGRRFHFTDPNGTELAVWSDRTAAGTKIE